MGSARVGGDAVAGLCGAGRAALAQSGGTSVEPTAYAISEPGCGRPTWLTQAGEPKDLVMYLCGASQSADTLIIRSPERVEPTFLLQPILPDPEGNQRFLGRPVWIPAA
jgi:hypothetical protein